MNINNEIKSKLRELKLPEAVDFLEKQSVDKTFIELPFEDQLELLLDNAISIKQAKKINQYIRGAKFSIPNAKIEDIYYDGRSIDKRKILNFANNNYLYKHINLIITGPTGSGKTFISNALGVNACRGLIRTGYIRMPTLLETIEMAKLNHRHTNYINKYGNYDLLIIDEWLLRKINSNEINILLEILEKRIDKSTIFCTQYNFGDWLYRMKQEPIAESIINRIVSCAITVDLDSTDMRAREGEKILKEYKKMS